MKKLFLIPLALILANTINAQCSLDLSMEGKFVNKEKSDTIEVSIKGLEVQYRDSKGIFEKSKIDNISIQDESLVQITFQHNWETKQLVLSLIDKSNAYIETGLLFDEYGDPVRMFETYVKVGTKPE